MPNSGLAQWTFAGATSALASVLIATGGIRTWAVAAGIAAVAGLLVLRARLGSVGPSQVLTIVVLVLGVCGFVFYPALVDLGPAPSLYAYSNSEGLRTLAIYMSAAAAAALGGAAASLLTSAGPSTGLIASLRTYKLQAESAKALVAICSVLTLVLLFGCDVPALVLRDTYQGFYGPVPEFFRIGNGLSLPVSLACCYVLFNQSASNGTRSAAGACLALQTLIAAGTCSRQLALIPPLLLTSYLLSQRRKRLATGSILMAACLVALAVLTLLHAVLFLRETGEHGLARYARTAIAQPEAVFSIDQSRAAANLLNGFAKANYVANKIAPIEQPALVAQVNPLPSRIVGGQSQQELRVRSYIPYNAIGTLANWGMLPLLLYYASLSALLTTLSTWSSRLPRAASTAMSLLLTTSGFLIAVLSTQYQLRTITRLATYLLILVPVVVIVSRSRDALRFRTAPSTRVAS